MIYTIGVYGFSETEFFSALDSNNIKSFWDVRSRRGMRGSQYKFVNSNYLQERLREMDIAYKHVKDLAPTDETRQMQRGKDRLTGLSKSQRQHLSTSFINSYFDQLQENEWYRASRVLALGPVPVALFCVERAPEACHRSLAAEKLAQILKQKIQHITPEGV